MTDPSLIKDLFERGRRFATEGRLTEAETVLREALRLTRGRDDASEARACGNLGTFYGIHGRNFEALLLYRRALAIDRAREDWRLVVLHLANLATIYTELDLHARLQSLIQGMDDALVRLGEEDPRHRPTWERTLFARFEAALWLGDREGARALLPDLRRATKDEEPRIAAQVDLMEARLRRLEDDPAGALAAVEHGLAVADLPSSVQLDLLVERVRAAERLRDETAVRRMAEEAVNRLAAAGGDSHLVEIAITAGSRLAAALERVGGSAEHVRRAYDLAASATLERIRQLDACLRDLPELSTTTAEDHAWFAELREQFAKDQEALLRRVAPVLEAARAAGDSPLHPANDTDGLIRLCAWCCTVKTREGRWLPVAHFIPSEPNVRVTHSICPPCAERMRGR